jgi:hypothetical protein
LVDGTAAVTMARLYKAVDWSSAALLACMAAMFLLHLCRMTFADPDLWHEMALARETLAEGRVPADDRFAFTPTVSPSVHHEWGTGMLLYGVFSALGPGGIMALKYALSLGIMGVCLVTAARRGATLPLLALLFPLVIMAGVIGYTTLRAQVFTLFFLALLLRWFDADRRGGRAWMVLCIPMFLVWLNLHAGFVLGLALLAVHGFEMLLRRRPWAHLLLLTVALAALVAVNPYGLAYYGYLSHALLMDRGQITEWWPLWRVEPGLFHAYLASLVLLAYCGKCLGWRRLEGLLVLLVTAYAAARHARHLSIYLVAWLSYVPGYMQPTPLGQWVQQLWQRRRPAIVAAASLLAVVCLARAMVLEPWRLRVPVDEADGWAGLPVYPAGAVAYLRGADFRGNLMTPFITGGYCIWELYPQVKVSLDGRYEVAYQPGVFEDHVTLYEAQPGWRDILRKYAGDMLLVPVGGPLAAQLGSENDWQRVYADPAYELYAPRPATNRVSAHRSASRETSDRTAGAASIP